jgi:hypothetical protein
MKLWKVALLAFTAMCIQDLLATSMVVAEAHFRPFIAGSFDAAQWIAMLASSGLAIESIVKEGWRAKRSLVIIGSVTTANFVGTIIGVTVASSFIAH